MSVSKTTTIFNSKLPSNDIKLNLNVFPSKIISLSIKNLGNLKSGHPIDVGLQEGNAAGKARGEGDSYFFLLFHLLYYLLSPFFLSFGDDTK